MDWEERERERIRKTKGRLLKHQQRLQEDSQYLEDFLEKTKIENQAEEIAGRLIAVYNRHRWEEELPTDLIEIINKAHADAEKKNREVGYVTENGHWRIYHRYPKPLLTDQAYWILKERSGQFLHKVEYNGLEKISYEEALEKIRTDKEVPKGVNPLTLTLLAASKSDSTWETMKMFLLLPVNLIYSAVISPFVPESTKAKWLMESHNSYCQEHYQHFKDEMKEIFELYQE